MDYFIAFLVGGSICGLAQLLMERTKMLPGRVMVLLVAGGVLLSAVGLYGPFAKWAGAGASVPLCGFGHLLMEGVRKGLKEDGFLGIFKGGLSASSAGITAALCLGLLAALTVGPTTKNK